MSTTTTPWDLLVLGGGTAGLVGATTAAQLGARVALVERDRTGGDCLWTGCVPSKALLAAANQAAQARRSAELGIVVGSLQVDHAAVLAHVREAIMTIEPQDSPARLREHGVAVLRGNARFTGPGLVEVDGTEHPFHRALLATGATPSLPDLPGLAQAAPLTSETIWTLETLPNELVVLGGGTVGCELGQAFARFGSRVTILEAGPRILPLEDPDAAEVVHRALTRDGVRILTDHRAVAVEPGDVGGTVLTAGVTEQVGYDTLLVALGRTPRTDAIGLDRAGVLTDPQGFVVVDPTLRTSNPRIWAAGDLTPHPQLTHLAGVHASVAASNAVLGLRRRAEVDVVPRVTFTDPEIAAVGTATWARGGERPRIVTRAHTEVDRAVTEGRTEGFSRLALGRGGRVLGGTIVGPRAGESLAEVALAVRHRLTVRDLMASVHAYPTYGDGIWNAAIDEVRRRLSHPAVTRVTAAIIRRRRSPQSWPMRRPSTVTTSSADFSGQKQTRPASRTDSGSGVSYPHTASTSSTPPAATLQ